MALKDIKHELDLETVNKLVAEGLSENPVNMGLVASFDGALLDNYLFENYNYKDGKGVVIGRKHKVRKYIIIRENYVNEWTSTNIATETNNEKKYKEFIDYASENGEVY